MRRARSILGAALAAGALAAAAPAAVPAQGKGPLTLSSPDITPGARIGQAHVFNSDGCTGRNVSPALTWSHVPAGTRSFALAVLDPDAPKQGGWWHWIIHDIPAQASGLPEGAGDPSRSLMPPGVVQERNDFGTLGYGGPCPPPGKPHHYHFILYALRVPRLRLPSGASAGLIQELIVRSAIAHAELVGVYGQ